METCADSHEAETCLSCGEELLVDGGRPDEAAHSYKKALVEGSARILVAGDKAWVCTKCTKIHKKDSNGILFQV
jgi:hypothetical protein